MILMLEIILYMLFLFCPVIKRILKVLYHYEILNKWYKIGKISSDRMKMFHHKTNVQNLLINLNFFQSKINK